MLEPELITGNGKHLEKKLSAIEEGEWFYDSSDQLCQMWLVVDNMTGEKIRSRVYYNYVSKSKIQCNILNATITDDYVTMAGSLDHYVKLARIRIRHWVIENENKGE